MRVNLIALDRGIGYFAAIMKLSACFIVIAPLLVSACGVPDIIAHGVKAYEKAQDEQDKADQAQPAPAAAQSQTPPDLQTDAPPPPVIVPRRDSVTKEPLK